MLHVRLSQLIIAGDVCSIQGDFFPGAWQWKTSDVMLMKIFGKICGNIRNMKYIVIGQARLHFTCNTFVQK